MRPALTLPQPLECLAPAENLATLLGQRGEVSGELVLPCHTDREDLVGFLPSRRPAEGWPHVKAASLMSGSPTFSITQGVCWGARCGPC